MLWIFALDCPTELLKGLATLGATINAAMRRKPKDDVLVRVPYAYSELSRPGIPTRRRPPIPR